MRQFIQIVENAQEAPPPILYHGTSILSAALILSAGRISAENEDEPPVGVSLTTCPDVAKIFADDQRDEDTLHDNMAENLGAAYEEISKKIGECPGGAIFVFSTAAIKNKLVPFTHPEVEQDEKEFRAVGRSLRLDGLTEVRCARAHLEWWIAAAQEARMRGWANALRKMMNHPVLRLNS